MKPTPTPEMIEAAARRLTELEGLNPDERASELHTGLIWEEYKDSAEAILSAALSEPAAAVVGEPVAWIAQSRWEQMTAAEPWLTNVVYSEDQAASFPCVPLYAAPSPPDGQTLAERMEKARQERRLEDALRHITLVRDEVSDARFRAFALSTANTALGGASHE